MDQFIPTNFNGVYDTNETLNERVIQYCDQDQDPCFTRDEEYFYYNNTEYWKTFKLKSTNLFLSRGET